MYGEEKNIGGKLLLLMMQDTPGLLNAKALLFYRYRSARSSGLAAVDTTALCRACLQFSYMVTNCNIATYNIETDASSLAIVRSKESEEEHLSHLCYKGLSRY